MVEVNEAEGRCARAGKGGDTVRADAATTDYDEEGGAELVKTVIIQKDSVAGELFKYEL